MSTKLNEITTQYRKFNTNQVLTEDQLNEFLDYFEDQGHLSRVGLSGVGIVCGFKVTYNAPNKTITITQGYGVTTDGDLLTLQNPILTASETISNILKSIDLTSKTYTHYRAYSNEHIKYKPFFYIGETQIELWELQTTEEISGDTSFKTLDTLSTLEDKVVLLYLENYSKESELCTAITCDNQGIEQVAKLKVLLVSTENAKYIAGLDTIYDAHNWYEMYLALPEVKAKRIIFGSSNTKTLQAVKQNYHNAIKLNSTLSDLKLGFEVIFSKFNKPSISFEIENLFNFTSTSIPSDFQYRYDVLKDLIDTYNDIKGLLLHINVECCPDIGSFPKHLLLGKLVESAPFASLRHRFYKSPIIGHEDDNYQKVLSLLVRAKELAVRYLNENKGAMIKITPSQAHTNLSQKAIPFYYNVDGDLINHWSYEKFKNYRQQYNLSYHSGNLSNSQSVQQPLDYNLDTTTFYRIEGHQGQHYRDALKQIFNIKHQKALNFDVKVLSINASTENINPNDYNCEFEDLSVLLKAWTREQECVLKEVSGFFSAFRTDAVEKNNKDVEYTGKKIPRTFSVLGNIDTIELALEKSMNSYGRPNVVEENLTLEDHTVGKYIKEAIIENKNGSINDIKNAAKEKIAQEVSTGDWNANAEIRDFTIYKSIDLIVDSYILTEKIPETIATLDKPAIALYDTTLKSVCQLVKQLKVKVNSKNTKLNDNLKNIMSLLITQLSTVCCSGVKLKILLEEIEKRKLSILRRIQLSEFVKKNPGLEHKAGVQPGGTFVMVYLKEAVTDEPSFEPVTLVLEFLKQPNLFGKDSGQIHLWNDRISTKFNFSRQKERNAFVRNRRKQQFDVVEIGKTIEETVSNLADFLNTVWRIAGVAEQCKAISKKQKLAIQIKDQPIGKKEYFVVFSSSDLVGTAKKIFFGSNSISTPDKISKNTVVADFALPYMCCSDCAPVNFIIPTEPVFLSLPVPSVCVDNATKPLDFTVSPEDGEVKAVVDIGINGGVEKNANGKYIFNPLSVDQSLYDTTIHFTVNGKQTDCKIVVSLQKTIEVKVQSIKYNDNKTTASVIFEVLGDVLPKEATFKWDLGDGNAVVEKPDANGIFIASYKLPVNDANTVQPNLIIDNVPCLNEIAVPEIKFDDPVEDTCLKDTLTVIKRDARILRPDVDISRTLKNNVLLPAIALYKEVVANADDYLSGAQNANLDALFAKLLSNTFQAIVKNAQNSFVLGELLKIYNVLIKLFFNILNCQSNEVLLKNADKIMGILEILSGQFKKLKANDIKFDKNKKLSAYLNKYINDRQRIDFLVDFIKSELLPFII